VDDTRPWQSFPLARRTTDPLRAEIRPALRIRSPPRSSLFGARTIHPAQGSTCNPAFLVAIRPRPWLLLILAALVSDSKDQAGETLLRTAQRIPVCCFDPPLLRAGFSLRLSAVLAAFEPCRLGSVLWHLLLVRAFRRRF